MTTPCWIYGYLSTIAVDEVAQAIRQVATLCSRLLRKWAWTSFSVEIEVPSIFSNMTSAVDALLWSTSVRMWLGDDGQAIDFMLDIRG